MDPALRHRERRARRAGTLFFWRDRTREVDFVIDRGGRLELFEAKWTEIPSGADAVNLAVREAIGRARVVSGAIVCRAPHPFPLEEGFRALDIAALAEA